MTIDLTVNGVVYPYPQTGDEDWGYIATNWAAAITGGTLQKAGGNFFLTADVDFGPSFGLKALNFTSRTAASPASSGVVRLGNDETICWRNVADDGNLCLVPDASDLLTFNNIELVDVSSPQTISNKEFGSGITFDPAFVLPIDNGGTGQATQTDAFDALSPLTTKGDMIVFNGTDNVRLPVGSDGAVLLVDSSQSTGVKWFSAPVVALTDPGGNGVVVRTSAGVTTFRTITGTTGTITVSNGTGVSGDPTITIADNPVLPGTGSVTVPVGTSAQQPGTPVEGMLRYDSDTDRFVGYESSTWKNVATENYVQNVVTSGYQPLDADLTALAATATTGIYVRTGGGTSATRTITQPSAGITISNADGVSGNPTLALADDLAAVEGLSGSGIAVRVGLNSWTNRTLVAPAAGLTISTADGVSDNPTFALANDLAAVEALTGQGLAVRTGTDTWTNRTIVSNSAAITVSDGNGVSANPSLTIDATLQNLANLSGVQGDLIYYNGTDSVALLAKNTSATRYLSNTGTSNNPAWAQVDLTNGVTGTLPISSGGTGGTTLTDAFDNIAPSTTKGDIIVHNGSDNVRVPVGSDLQALVADSTDSEGVAWTSLTSKHVSQSPVVIDTVDDFMFNIPDQVSAASLTYPYTVGSLDLKVTGTNISTATLTYKYNYSANSGSQQIYHPGIMRITNSGATDWVEVTSGFDNNGLGATIPIRSTRSAKWVLRTNSTAGSTGAGGIVVGLVNDDGYQGSAPTTSFSIGTEGAYFVLLTGGATASVNLYCYVIKGGAITNSAGPFNYSMENITTNDRWLQLEIDNPVGTTISMIVNGTTRLSGVGAPVGVQNPIVYTYSSFFSVVDIDYFSIRSIPLTRYGT